MLAKKSTFRNCRVVMRPKTKATDLPSINDVRIYLRNAFVWHVEQVQNDIEVSTTIRLDYGKGFDLNYT
jgi:hypothetical protein